MNEKLYLLDNTPVTAWELIDAAKQYEHDDEVRWMWREHMWFTTTCAAVLRRNGHTVKERN